MAVLTSNIISSRRTMRIVSYAITAFLMIVLMSTIYDRNNGHLETAQDFTPFSFDETVHRKLLGTSDDFNCASCDPSLACINGTCSRCETDAQCQARNHRNICVSTKHGNVCALKHLFPHFDVWDGLATGLCFIGGAFSASGGVGGGGLFVPLLIAVGRYPPTVAIPLSKVMIFGAAIANFVVFGRQRHPNANRPLIDFDAAIIMEPITLAGTIIGVYCNIAFPSWLILLLLILVLLVITWKTFKKGIEKHREEVKAARAAKEANVQVQDDGERKPLISSQNSEQATVQPIVAADADYKPISAATTTATATIADVEERIEVTPEEMKRKAELEKLLKKEARIPWLKISTLFITWIGIVVLAVLKGGDSNSGASVIGIKKCSWQYWVIVAAAFPFTFFMTWIIGFILRREYFAKKRLGFTFIKGDIQWTPKATYVYPFLCLIAGIAAGALGIGGGMVKGPILLELGVLPQVSAATAAFMILFTSSCTSAQFAILGLLKWDYALWYAANGFISSMIGQYVMGAIVKKYKKASLVVFLIVAIIVLSMLMLGAQDAYSVYLGVKNHQNMGFKNICTAQAA